MSGDWENIIVINFHNKKILLIQKDTVVVQHRQCLIYSDFKSNISIAIFLSLQIYRHTL